MVQTADPGQPAMQALLRADPGPFIRAEARSRRELGFPPGGEVLALEARGVDPVEASEELEGEVGDRAEIHGPAQLENGTRWLLQGPDLGRARVVLRGVVGRWRDAGARVRVDADPIDL